MSGAMCASVWAVRKDCANTNGLLTKKMAADSTALNQREAPLDFLCRFGIAIAVLLIKI
jgi:hypothetical protein